jgi:esterase/lipase superfamily enzyme
MNERYIRWWTPHMSREFEMLVFGDARGLPLILFPTSFGRYSQNKDFGLIDACAPFIDSGKITIYCSDSADLEGFYNKNIHPADRMRTHNAYERVIVDDVFDFARRECSCHRVAICGASLGAYHAANIAFRFPDAVSHLISLSGAFEISDFFDGYHDENIYFNSPYQYLPNIVEPMPDAFLVQDRAESEAFVPGVIPLAGAENDVHVIEFPRVGQTAAGAGTIGIIGATCSPIISPRSNAGKFDRGLRRCRR